MDGSFPDEPNGPAAKARAAFATSPEEQWRRELSSKNRERAAGAALALGRLAAANRDLEEAVKLLVQAASFEVPTVMPRALVAQVRVFEELGRNVDADQALRDAQRSSDPVDTPDVILDVSAILVARGQSDGAIQVLESVVEAGPEDVQRATDDGTGLARAIAALRLGNLLRARGDTAHAIPAWERATAANFPAVTPEAALRLADAFVAEYLGGGKRPPAEIEELYRIAIDFDDPAASPEAALRLADFFVEEEQPQLAAMEYQSLLPIGGEIADRAEVGLKRARDRIELQPLEKMRQRARSTRKKMMARPRAIATTRDRAVIVGAGTGGKYLVRDLDTERYEVSGWVDDRQKKGSLIGDFPVLGTIDELPQVLAQARPKVVFIAIPTMSGARRRKVVEAALDAGGVKVKNLPSMFELARGRNIFRQLRDVRVEETMGEQPMSIDRDAGSVVRGLSVMVTGAGSTVGTELSRQVAHARARYLSLVDISTMALRRVVGDLERNRDFGHALAVLGACDNVDTMGRALAAHSPHVVFHVAGHGYGPIAEENPLEAMRTDFVGTWDFARLCGEAKVGKFVLVSNDAAGESRGIFSASKALAERAVTATAEEFPDTDFVSIRVGSLYRSVGSVVEVFEQQIEAGGPLTLTAEDAKRRFMRVELATQLLLRTAETASSGGIYALHSEEEVAVRELAEWMIRLEGGKGAEVGIEVTGPREHEKRGSGRRLPQQNEILTEVKDVIAIEPPRVPPEVIASALAKVRATVQDGDSVGLLRLVGEGVPKLLDAESKAGAEIDNDSEAVPW